MIRAIQTEYRGHLFRSRLEARWAVFFDALGVRWLYEHEGFATPSGPYLPDFILPDLRLIVEVKPDQLDASTLAPLCVPSLCHVARALGCRATVHDEIPDPTEFGVSGPLVPSDRWPVIFWHKHQGAAHLGGDINYQWCACPACNAIGFEYDGRSSRVTHREGCPITESTHGKMYAADHPSVLDAYRAARSARFEHGHSGAML